MQPSFTVDGGSRSFLVLVVAFHHVLATEQDFADLGFGMRRIDNQLVTSHHFTAGAHRLLVPVLIGHQRTSLGHAVADHQRELDAAQHALHVLVQSGTARNQPDQVAAKGVHQLIVDFFLHDFTKYRRVPQCLDTRLSKRREDFSVEDFLDYQRHGQDHVGLGLGVALQQRGR